MKKVFAKTVVPLPDSTLIVTSENELVRGSCDSEDDVVVRWARRAGLLGDQHHPKHLLPIL